MMFSFTSMGGKIDVSMNDGNAPPMFIMIHAWRELPQNWKFASTAWRETKVCPIIHI